MIDQQGCSNCSLLIKEQQDLLSQIKLLTERLNALSEIVFCDTANVATQTISALTSCAITTCQTVCDIIPSVEQGDCDSCTKLNNSSEHSVNSLDKSNDLTLNLDHDTNDPEIICISPHPDLTEYIVPNTLNVFSYNEESKELVEPYSMYPGNPFSRFDVKELDMNTNYTKVFDNRSVAHYGTQSYHYSGVTHKPNPLSNNPYLCDIIEHAKTVVPNLCFNSVMVTKYRTGQDHLPYHSDNETAIVHNSNIVTISFGCTRQIKFRAIKNSKSELSVSLPHGNIFLMSYESQGHFEHCIAKDFSKYVRISVTLRLLQTTTNVTEAANISAPQRSNEIGYKPPSYDGYQPPSSSTSPPQHEQSNVNITNKSKNITTLYISSSMFRDLSAEKLSSKYQNAAVLFFPGATAGDMLKRLKKSDEFKEINPKFVTKVYLLTGTNNVDRVLNDTTSNQMQHAFNEIYELINFLHNWSMNSSINIINVFPRASSQRNWVINNINAFLYDISCNLDYVIFVNTEATRSLFSTRHGYRKDEYFRSGRDNVHFNVRGIVKLGRHLKHIAHEGQDVNKT